MTRLSQSSAAADWIRQFTIDDQKDMAEMLDAMLLVNHDEFFDLLRKLALSRARSVDTPIGLYAEREIAHRRGVPHRLFKERPSKGKVRAWGVGPKPIQPTRTYDPQIGSEGLVAFFITQLCREFPKEFLSHPGPDQIRAKKVRSFWVITDFIGSGERVCSYLSSAWRVASVKSWWSYDLITFEVLAYSGTDDGKKYVEKHRCRPSVHLAHACPTIDSAFSGTQAERIRNSCIQHDPVDHDLSDSLGFGGSGALIAFAHGCPNNAPRILHRKGKRWMPLFPGRVTAKVQSMFGSQPDGAAITNRLARLRQSQLAKGGWLPQTHREGRWMILTLAALRRGPRFDEALSRKTGLSILDLRALIEQAIAWGWVTDQRHLTDSGIRQLIHARRIESRKNSLSQIPKEPYYPKSLRAPV